MKLFKNASNPIIIMQKNVENFVENDMNQKWDITKLHELHAVEANKKNEKPIVFLKK